MIPILALTAQEYGQAVLQALGKGENHARLLYQEWIRSGTHLGGHPAFNNAVELRANIQSLTDWSIMQPEGDKTDGATQKILLKTAEGLAIESVVIPMEAGGTLCISSQVGCRMGCRFCETGRMGLLKNLTPQEIVGQVFYAIHEVKAQIRNIVFMGMGEPFDNYDAVMQAFRVLNDPLGFHFGERHITISTSGCVEEIKRLAMEPISPHLAVSINAPNDALRTRLMPINRTYPLAEVKEAIRFFNEKTGRKVLVAYVLIKDVNDDLSHAEELAEYLRGLDIKINLIPYNPQTHDRFQRPNPERVAEFKAFLLEQGYQVLLRTTKGDQIMAACGQLGRKRKVGV